MCHCRRKCMSSHQLYRHICPDCRYYKNPSRCDHYIYQVGTRYMLQHQYLPICQPHSHCILTSQLHRHMCLLRTMRIVTRSCTRYTCPADSFGIVSRRSRLSKQGICRCHNSCNRTGRLKRRTGRRYMPHKHCRLIQYRQDMQYNMPQNWHRRYWNTCLLHKSYMKQPQHLTICQHYTGHMYSRSSRRHFQKTYRLHNLCTMDFRLVGRTQVSTKQQAFSHIGLADTYPVGNLRIRFDTPGPGIYRLSIYHTRCPLLHYFWFPPDNMCKQKHLGLSTSLVHNPNRLP